MQPLPMQTYKYATEVIEFTTTALSPFYKVCHFIGYLAVIMVIAASMVVTLQYIFKVIGGRYGEPKS